MDVPMPAAFLDVIDLRKDYGAANALNGVSFQVEQGELFGLLGPNGAGKTTLLSILSCLLSPTAGNAWLQGKSLRPSNRSVRPLIGIVPQELAIYSELTARENLVFFGELYGVRGALLRRRVDDILATVALADRADQRAGIFSGGMKRRLNLGVALVHAPALLLLDEPTVGVDPQSRNHIFESVRRLNAEGVTVVYTSHYMEEVQSLCTRVGIIDHGRLVACDALQSLLQQLNGLIRFRVPRPTPILRERLKELPDCTLSESDSAIELECRDVKVTLLRLLTLLNELRVEMLSLETEEPNLERVFLHLTGRALRD
jgi:ABC-2 type transport system ATP-binding protein